ncbi:Dihydrolipoyl dehydrogenase [Buchnera aphidicola (Periphyllus testudinaceus)]|uniref:dihydrolipoyl dehydrogenase n=1 Tax=Buchnera aphidicola TaxID=9 RepID=UPI003463B5F8
MNKVMNTDLVVIGGGPAGYSAAFRASDLGIKTVLIEKYSVLGGVCLNVGCIPSKALLHFSKVLQEYKEFFELNIITNNPEFNFKKIQSWKNQLIRKMNTGLKILSKQRKIKVLKGMASFLNKNKILVKNNDSTKEINFNYAIIATGSSSIKLPQIKVQDKRIWYSTDAVNLPFIPRRMLIIGAGVIGLEMATVYSSLGSKIDVIESSDMIFSSADFDVSSFFIKSISDKFNIILNSFIENINFSKEHITVKINTKNVLKEKKYDVILVSIGRFPNIDYLNLNNIDVKLDNRKFIIIDDQCQTNIPGIFSIGDVSGHPMLAHKGIYQAHIAAEVISGKNHYFDTKVIPNICYTDPEVCWVGMTEKEAIKKNIKYHCSIFPWNASGRACVSNSSLGMTKLIFNKLNNKIIGGAIVGRTAGELLGEISLAIEMGCDISDISLTMHAHPTLYESIQSASKIEEKTITDLLNIK